LDAEILPLITIQEKSMGSGKIKESDYTQWLARLKEKIRGSQLKAALIVNKELLSLYWYLGKAIAEKQIQANSGDRIIPQLSKDLISEFPEIKGFSVTNLKYVRRWHQFYSQDNQHTADETKRRRNWSTTC